MASVTAVMIVLLVLGMIAHVLFEAADRAIRRRRGLDLQV
jgi:hypothetical protein